VSIDNSTFEKDKIVLLGTSINNLIKYDCENRTIISKIEVSPIESSFVRNISIDRFGKVWICSSKFLYIYTRCYEMARAYPCKEMIKSHNPFDILVLSKTSPFALWLWALHEMVVLDVRTGQKLCKISGIIEGTMDYNEFRD